MRHAPDTGTRPCSSTIQSLAAGIRSRRFAHRLACPADAARTSPKSHDTQPAAPEQGAAAPGQRRADRRLHAGSVHHVTSVTSRSARNLLRERIHRLGAGSKLTKNGKARVYARVDRTTRPLRPAGCNACRSPAPRPASN